MRWPTNAPTMVRVGLGCVAKMSDRTSNSSSWRAFPFLNSFAAVRRHPRWMWGLLTIAGLFCLYLLAGFFLVPGLVRSQATQWVRTNLDKQISLGEIHFNPLTFTLDVNDMAIVGGGAPMVGVGHLRVSFSPLSLLTSTYRFGELRLDRPIVRAVVRPDRTINLVELVPRTHSEEPAPAIRIDDLAVDQGHIFYADESQPGHPQAVLAPVTFTLKDFRTKSDKGSAFTLAAQSRDGEQFNWRGNLSIAPIASQGRLAITTLKAGTIQRFMGALLPITLTGGQIGLQADYDFSYGATGMRLNLSLPDLTLTGLSLDGKDMLQGTVALDRLNAVVGPVTLRSDKSGIAELKGSMPRLAVAGFSVMPHGLPPAEGIRLQGITLTGAGIDYRARTVALGNLTLNGADIFVRRARNGALSLTGMLPAKSTATAAHPASREGSATAAPADARPAAWKIALNDFVLSEGTVRLDDRAVTPEAKITVSAISATVNGASSDLIRPVAVHVDAKMNGGARIAADGTVTPASKTGDLKFNLSGLPLATFVGYMPAMPKLELRSGTASASGQVHFEGGDLTKLRFHGNAAIDRFNLLETSTNSPLFSWRSFSLAAIDYRNKRVTIGQAKLMQPLARVAVLPDRSFNFTALMAPKSQAAATAVPLQVSAPGPGTAAPAPKTSAKAGAPATASFLLNMRRLDISGGTMGFADYSIEPNFQARIEALRGHISNITNRPGQAAAINLSGHVIDRYSPVTIKGRIDPFAYGQLTDMQLSFRNIDLPVFNPYSGRYAGYAIAKGKLTTELSYKIDHRALQADQHIVVDQLEWGQATDSKDRVPLPVRLASALLKDRHGVIDLKLPVRGSLDDPTFSIWPIVWQVVGNIIEKAVTAPFQLIGALFEGADKAQFIDFAPGAASLPPGSADALGALAKALADRPVLKLDVPSGPGTAEDANAIADGRIDQILMADEIKSGKKADVASLDADERHDRLENLYSNRLGKDPEFPEFSPDALKATPGATPDMDEGDRRTLLESQWMREQLRPLFKPTEAQMAALGTARAAAIRDALLADGTVDPARVFLTTATGAAAADGHSRVALKFE